VSKVNDHVKNFFGREIGLKRGDIIQIVHLIDMEDIEGFAYSETAITASSVERVTERNKRKQQVINRLSLISICSLNEKQINR